MKLLLFIRSCYVYVNIAIGKICHYLVLKKQRKIIIKKPHTLSLLEDLSFENIIRK